MDIDVASDMVHSRQVTRVMSGGGFEATTCLRQIAELANVLSGANR